MRSSHPDWSHPATKGLLHKSFPYYDDLSYVFCKDQATGARSETFADVGSNVPNTFPDGVPLGESQEQDIPMKYSQGMDMSPDEMLGTRAGPSTEGRTGSSGSKRKRGGQQYESVEVIRSAMEFSNDQLKTIADWPKEKRAMEVELRAEVVKQLEDIPELMDREKVKLMRIIFRSVAEVEGFLSCPPHLKLAYCNDMLEDNA